MAAGVLVIAWAAVLTVETHLARSATAAIGGTRAPVVAAASDLYFALNDMDAQLANVLLVGDETGLGVTRSQALSIFETRRVQGDADLQTVAAAASDPSGVREVRAMLDQVGRYEALAAEALLLRQQDASPAGRPSVAALAKYRSATDLLRLTLLPGARELIDRQAHTLAMGADAERARVGAVRAYTIVFGVVLLVVLLAGQAYVTRRFRRMINPALVAATLVTLGLLTAGVLVGNGHQQRLRIAKQDAFDSLMVLQQARAVSYDANADESRYLLDPQRAQQYQQAFEAKTRQVVDLDGATLSTFDQRFSTALGAYRRDHRQVGWDGYLGTEFGNITFVGERAAAELTVERYQIYQADDRQIRRLAGTGQSRAAIALCTSYAPGGSNGRDLARWEFVPGAGALAVLVLVFAGLRARLAEYR